jgi:AraC-like DNA-binding protein
MPSDFLVSLIEADEKRVEQLVEKATLLGIGFHGKAFRTFAFFRDICQWKVSGSWESRNIPPTSILEIISDTCGSEEDTNLCALGDKTFLLMRWYHEEPFAITARMNQRVQLALKRLRERFGDSVSCCVSGPVHDIRELRSSLEECRRLRDAYFYAGSGLVVSQEPTWPAGPESLVYERFSEELVHLLHRPTDEGIARFVAGLTALGHCDLHPPDAVRGLLRRLLVDIDTAANKRGFVLEHPIAAADTFVACIRLFDWVLREYEQQARATLSRSSREEINKVLAHIHAHLGEAIKCESMASFVNLNCSYFSRLFKKEMGMSFTDYLMRQRVEHARDLLTHTRMSFEEITWAVGLENVSYFHRAFKKLTGMTPRQAR